VLPEGAERARDPGRLDETVRQEAVERRQRERAVLEHLLLVAAGAKRDHRAEHRVAQHRQAEPARMRPVPAGFQRHAAGRPIRVEPARRLQHVLAGQPDRFQAGQVEPFQRGVGRAVVAVQPHVDR
jgi:hypothetical protein